jgi:hypothetical protein
MFEIKDENGTIVDFNTLTKEQQDKIIQVFVDYICEARPSEFTFTKENFERLVEEVKNADTSKYNSDLWDSLLLNKIRRGENNG